MARLGPYKGTISIEGSDLKYKVLRVRQDLLASTVRAAAT